MWISQFHPTKTGQKKLPKTSMTFCLFGEFIHQFMADCLLTKTSIVDQRWSKYFERWEPQIVVMFISVLCAIFGLALF